MRRQKESQCGLDLSETNVATVERRTGTKPGIWTSKKESCLLEKQAVEYTPENDEGNVEYKWRLIDVTDDRLDHLTTQMKVRCRRRSSFVVVVST